MDFVLKGDARSLDILNAVSPGFTCAMAFAEHVADWVG
jgi:L-2-hydroxyglutarate oxidase